MRTVTSKLVTAKEASNYGFTISGTHAYIYEVRGVMVGCLGPNDMHEPGFRFDTIDHDAHAWSLSTEKDSKIEDCELHQQIRKIIAAIHAITAVIGEKAAGEKLGAIFPLLNMEQC